MSSYISQSDKLYSGFYIAFSTKIINIEFATNFIKATAYIKRLGTKMRRSSCLFNGGLNSGNITKN